MHSVNSPGNELARQLHSLIAGKQHAAALAILLKVFDCCFWKGSQPVSVWSGSPMLRKNEPRFVNFGWFHDRIVYVGRFVAQHAWLDAYKNAWVALVSWYKITFLV